MEMAEYEKKLGQVELKLCRAVDQLAHVTNLQAASARQEFRQELDTLSRQISEALPKMVSFAEFDQLRRQLGESADNSGHRRDIEALRLALESLEQHVGELQDNHKPQVQVQSSVQLEKALSSQTISVISERLAQFQSQLASLQEDFARQLDEVRTALFMTIEGLRKQIPLARDYQPSIEMLRTRVASLESLCTGKAASRQHLAEHLDSESQILRQLHTLDSRIAGIEDTLQAQAKGDIREAVVDGLAVRVLALEKQAGSDTAASSSLERRITAIESAAELTKLATRVELVERQVYDKKCSQAESVKADEEPQGSKSESKAGTVSPGPGREAVSI